MYQACIRVVFFFLLILSPWAWAQELNIQEGVHYERIDPLVLEHPAIKEHLAQDQRKVQVIEFFNYACYWCSKVHGPLTMWAKNQNNPRLAFYSYPAVFSQVWRNLGRIYLAVQELDNAAALDQAIFVAIHEQHIPVWQDSVLQKVLAQNNTSLEQFKQHYGSFLLESKLYQADQLAQAYQIDATPYIIINGPSGSYITNLTKTHDEALLIQVIDYLVQREQKFC